MLSTNEHLHFYLYRLQSQTKKKILVYKTELTFKISENCNFFQFFFTSLLIANGFSVGGSPICRSAALFPRSSAYAITFNL